MPPPHRPSSSPATGVIIARGCLMLGAVLACLLGLFMTGGGVWLIMLGGSWYSARAGIGCLAAGRLLLRHKPMGVPVLSLTVIAALVWALWEVHGKDGIQSWGFELAGRTGLPLGVLLLTGRAAAFLRRRQHFPKDRG